MVGRTGFRGRDASRFRLTKVQAVRGNAQGFKSFRIPRMSNLWSTN
jgi:hypothetical protein